MQELPSIWMSSFLAHEDRYLICGSTVNQINEIDKVARFVGKKGTQQMDVMSCM